MPLAYPRRAYPRRAYPGLALLRIAVGLLFLIFAEYKLTGPQFIFGGGMRTYVGQFVAHGAYPFMRPVLTGLVLPHATACALAVSLAELFIGLTLATGLLVRAGAAVGLPLMLSLLFSANYPGPAAPFWQYFGASLDHLILALVFLALLLDPADTRFRLPLPKRS